MTPKQRPSPGRGRVFWSDIERGRIVSRAADLRTERPSLHGLSLLRAALDALPPQRRRHLVALAQAPWFTRMVADEMKRRQLEANSREDTVAVLKDHRDRHKEWMPEHISRLDQMIKMTGEAEAERRRVIELLEEVLVELREMNRRLGSVAGQRLKVVKRR